MHELSLNWQPAFTAIEIATMVLTVASMAYSLLAIFAAWSFRLSSRRAQNLPAFAPGVSILKPVKGFDDGMYEAFRSHCQQTYAGEYELIFGAGSEDDPAVPAVHQLMAEFPNRAIKLVFCPNRLGANGKVSNLIRMQAEARYDYLLINDSDIRVGPHYLERVMRQFAATVKSSAGRKPTGMVTALYRGHASRTSTGRLTLGSKLEALGIATDFQAGVLVARLIERGIHFGLGSTLAVRREALAAGGGLEALVDQLADDYEMGARIAAAGYAIQLAPETVETHVPAYNWRGFWSHQLRWARTVRDSRKWGYVGLLFTHLIPLACINVLASGASFWSLWLLCLALCLRLGAAMQVGVGVLHDRQVLRDLWLLPIRDLVGFAIWVWSFASHTIEWRGERFLLKDGKLVKMNEPHAT
ncbi:bacteriohopanetetrol glucosamine biosynthesis glycosyltransferase HpnI [Acidicapsa dinghuensis]|uniref:Bacteriohopanetetrol glucosamine biosynthesis glycosyltransferase HpnI n=1 Tax=Acidicapsa dinghuensis TaxID=2218256 RepID=A0ABW1EK24_9BACT|nr:bacteriohopanetetrol glucosamine biosynthesis glycosyltransferase HpnI [Acidicapsa dinghuensis]